VDLVTTLWNIIKLIHSDIAVCAYSWYKTQYDARIHECTAVCDVWYECTAVCDVWHECTAVCDVWHECTAVCDVWHECTAVCDVWHDQAGRSHWGRNVGRGSLRIGCWGEYLGLRGTRWQGNGEKYILRSWVIGTPHQIRFGW